MTLSNDSIQETNNRMAYIRGGKRQLPEIWIKYQGAKTTAQVRLHYQRQTNEDTEQWLMNLVRERRLIKTNVDGVTMWDVPRRA